MVVGSRAQARVWRSEESTLRIWLPIRTVIVIEFSGHLTAPLAGHLMSETNRVLAHPQHTPLCIFNDWWEMKSYDSAARTELTHWAARIKPQLSTVHLLTQSKIVAMGISVANLALGGFLQGHTRRAEWNTALAKATGDPLFPAPVRVPRGS
jgi:hypothetical protein